MHSSPTSGCRSVGMVRSRTKATELVIYAQLNLELLIFGLLCFLSPILWWPSSKCNCKPKLYKINESIEVANDVWGNHVHVLLGVSQMLQHTAQVPPAVATKRAPPVSEKPTAKRRKQLLPSSFLNTRQIRSPKLRTSFSKLYETWMLLQVLQ
jgi:hypothetical protein